MEAKVDTLHTIWGLSQKEAIETLSHLITTILHYGMCDKCGQHPQRRKAIAAVVNYYSVYAPDENHKAYTMYMLGHTIEDHKLYNLMLELKEVDEQDTYMAIREAVVTFYADINSPLN